MISSKRQNLGATPRMSGRSSSAIEGATGIQTWADISLSEMGVNTLANKELTPLDLAGGAGYLVG